MGYLVDPAYYACDGYPIYDNSTYGYPINCQCNATFNADADIAGLGVIGAFLAAAWITCIVAAISASWNIHAGYQPENASLATIIEPQDHYVSASESGHPINSHRPNPASENGSTQTNLQQYNPRSPNSSIRNRSADQGSLRASAQPALPPIGAQRDPHARVRVRVAIQSILDMLCDLQLITGTAIIIAGFSQLPHIAYYHESLIVNYWQLTLNSFWAAQASRQFSKDENAPTNNENSDSSSNVRSESPRKILSGDIPETMRAVAIFCSVVLYLAFQLIVILRENFIWREYQWEIQRHGRCYRYHDQCAFGQVWIWYVGLTIYAVFLMVNMFEASSQLVNARVKCCHVHRGLP